METVVEHAALLHDHWVASLPQQLSVVEVEVVRGECYRVDEQHFVTALERHAWEHIANNTYATFADERNVVCLGDFELFCGKLTCGGVGCVFGSVVE